MEKLRSKKLFFKNKKPYLLLVAIILFCIAVYESSSLLQPCFKVFINIAPYLTWHNMFEFIAILVSFAIFVVRYFTYDQTRLLRALFLGNVFLSTGIIEAFHTLSFSGMPVFFIENSGANRGTTFWIILSLLSAIGLFIGTLIPIQKKSNLNKRYFLSISLTLCLIIFIVVTYYPEYIPQMYIEDKGLTFAKIYTERLISILFIFTAAKLLFDYKKTKDFQDMIFCYGVIFRMFAGYAFVRYVKIDDIYNFIGHIFLCIAYFLFFRVAFINNVQQPYLQLAKAKKVLKKHAENLDKAVNERTQELKKLNQKLLDDLEYARDIQKAMLPARLPDEREVSFYAQYFPVESVGGDFYNIFKLDENSIGMYIGDVSGHGVSAAMLTVFINQSIATIKEKAGDAFEIIKPSMVLKKVYEEFNRINFKDDVYLVMIYAIFNIKNKELTYSSAGMNVAPLIIEKFGRTKELEIHGFPICKFSEFYSANYVDSAIKLNDGDKVLFYTDGITEAEGQNDERFSEERLIEIVSLNSGNSCSIIGEHITNEVFNFIDMSKLNDDITLFIMEVH